MSEVIKHNAFLWERKGSGKHAHWLFWCPGCGHCHTYRVGFEDSPNWTFNGLLERPSFSPSLLHFTTDPETNQRRTECHLFLTDGKIQYCSDNPHALNGQTVEMVPIPVDYGFN